MNLVVVFISLTFLLHPFCKAEDIQLEKKGKEKHAKVGKHPNGLPISPVKHHFHPVSTNVCNMSLIASIEKENLKYRACVCDEQNGAVDCSHLGLTELPTLISFPKHIQIASFRNNRIESLAPETFYNGENVTELNLSHNHIDFISKTAFRNFKNLERLDLGHNLIWNIPKNVFVDFVKLQQLDLSFNNLIYVTTEHFKNLVELRELSLKSNPIQELGYKSFENFQKLEFLDLDNAQLSELPAHIFVFTPNLRILKLAGNRLTEVPSDSFFPMEHLKILDLSRNPIKAIDQSAFRGLTGLTTLTLNRMPRLNVVENYAFGDLINLQELHCNHNLFLQEIASDTFVEKSSGRKIPLLRLYLTHNALRNVPESLLNWNENVELHLVDNPFHCDCHMTWMTAVQLKNDFQSHAKCFSPAQFANVALSDLKTTKLTCDVKDDWSDIILILSIAILFLLVLSIAISFLIWSRGYRRKGTTKFSKLDKTALSDVNTDCYCKDDVV